MRSTSTTPNLWRRQIALPGEHGAWVFLFSPWLMGLLAGAAAPGARWTGAVGWLLLGSLAAFLLRPPATRAVKALSGRRPRADLPAAVFWLALYGLVGLAAVAGLVAAGFGYLLVLALPAVPVFAWHLALVSRRAERRQLGVELVGSGALALAAPAAYWVMAGAPVALGWWLWALAWLQSAASIVYAYLRLEQRALRAVPPLPERLRLGWRAVLYAAFNLLCAAALGAAGVTPPWVWLAYAVQLAETVWGTMRPAVGVPPTRIGVRQLIVSTVFTVVFVLAWRW
jgi:hypothetical protein